MNTLPSSLPASAVARFLRTISTAALELAQAVEAGTTNQPRSLDALNLGSLQRQVADALLALDCQEGITPREITRHLERGDEPNVRSALQRLQTATLAELLSGPGPQRWRLAASYRDQIQSLPT